MLIAIVHLQQQYLVEAKMTVRPMGCDGHICTQVHVESHIAVNGERASSIESCDFSTVTAASPLTVLCNQRTWVSATVRAAQPL